MVIKTDSEICETILVTSRMANMTYLVGVRKKGEQTKNKQPITVQYESCVKYLSTMWREIPVAILEM